MSRFYGDFDPASTATTVFLSESTTTTGSAEAVIVFNLESDTVNTGGGNSAGESISSSAGVFTFSTAVGTPYGAGTAVFTTGGNTTFGSAIAVDFVEFTSGQAFSFEYWAYFNGTPSAYAQIVDCRSDNANPGGVLQVAHGTGGRLVFSDGGGGSESNFIIRGPSTGIVTGAWQHFAVSRDSSSTIRMFYDGVQVATTARAFAADNKANGGRPHFLGNVNTNAADLGSKVPGGAYLRDFRVIKDACIYTTAFEPPTSPLTTTSTNIVLTTSSSTRTHSHVWNYTDVYDARFADTWPTIDTGPTTLSHIVRFDASMPGAVDTAAGTWTSVSGSRHPTTLVNGTTATLLAGDQNGLNVVRTNSAFKIASADQVSTITSAYAFVCVYSRNSDTSNNDIYPVRTGVGNDNNSIGIEIRPSALVGGHDFDIYGGNSRDREVTVAGANFSTADFTRFLIMASGNSSDGIHNVKVVVRGGTSSAVTLGTNGSNRNVAPKFSDSNVEFPHAGYNNNMDYCEIIFYDVELSSADMITEADRLATKWGL